MNSSAARKTTPTRSKHALNTSNYSGNGNTPGKDTRQMMMGYAASGTQDENQLYAELRMINNKYIEQ